MKDYLAYEPSDAWDGYTTLARQYDGLRLDKDEAMAVASRIAELCRRTWKASFYEADPTQSSFPVQAEGSKEWTDFYELRKKHEEATTDEEREAIAKEIKAVVDLWNSWVEDEAVYICDDEDEIEVCQHELNTICTIKILHLSYTEDTTETERQTHMKTLIIECNECSIKHGWNEY